MKNFSLKKIMLMLVALFMLGACSTTDITDTTDGVNSNWASLVGGKTIYGYDSEAGRFSSDASRLILINSYYIDSLDIQTSTDNSATYYAIYYGEEDGVKFSVEWTIEFSDPTSTGVKAQSNIVNTNGDSENMEVDLFFTAPSN